MDRKIIIGSRGSRLALWQAHFVQDKLKSLGHEVDIKIIKTKGDQIQHLTFDKIEGKGFFTKELETALLEEEIDLAVHSYKDLPTEQPSGLTIAANSYRENPADWLIINTRAADKSQYFSLKENAVVGTSSPRRKAQLLAFRPDLKVVPIRGNVPTRVNKLQAELDAVVLAAAGLERLELDLSNYHRESLPLHHFIPAPAQGVLAYQTRVDDDEIKHILKPLHDPEIEKEIYLERAILRQLEGGCQQPIGIYAKAEEQNFQLWGTHSASENELPKRIFLQGNDADSLIKQTTDFLKSNNPQRIFISRDLDSNSFFKRVLEHHGNSIFGTSLINFSPISFDTVPSSDWVFFSSKKAVHFFFSQIDPTSSLSKIAAIGEGTAEAIKALGQEVHFVGNKDDVLEVATDFGKQAAGSTVLFPRTVHSQRTIQNQLAKEIEIIDLVVYSNVAKTDFEIPESDIIVLTSPKNAETYLGKYPIQAKQTLVAIGKATAAILEKYGHYNYRTPFLPSEISLVDVCY